MLSQNSQKDMKVKKDVKISFLRRPAMLMLKLGLPKYAGKQANRSVYGNYTGRC